MPAQVLFFLLKIPRLLRQQALAGCTVPDSCVSQAIIPLLRTIPFPFPENPAPPLPPSSPTISLP